MFIADQLRNHLVTQVRSVVAIKDYLLISSTVFASVLCL